MQRSRFRSVLAVTAAVLCTKGAHAQPGGWTQFSGSGPSARCQHAMAYDSRPGRHVVVLFGGDLGSGPTDETWEWDGDSWTRRNPTISPSARHRPAMAYDSSPGRHVAVLFGGFDGVDVLGDTWEWNGDSWVSPIVDIDPPARFGHAVAYDAHRGVTVMFGGIASDYTALGDTWEWNGHVWTKRDLATGPSPRHDHAMAYDMIRGVTVLFGGYHNELGDFGETWEWDGERWLLQSNSGPSPRHTFAMAYDADRRVTVLFGGHQGLGGPKTYSDTWAWNGTVWVEQPFTGPSARHTFAMAYDLSRAKTVLFGGHDGTDFNDETWTLDLQCPADFDGSGFVDTDDFTAFVLAFEAGC